MFLPEDVHELCNKSADKVYAADVLDGKTKELIALSCSVMADCVPCIGHHCREAVNAGATREEIAEALAISMSVGTDSKRAKYTQVISDLERDKAGSISAG
jgi:AhpD family alkylhydroperoxidase